MSTTERSRTSARRTTLLGDQPGAYASARYVRITPMKARRVVDMVRGLQVDEGPTMKRWRPRAQGRATRINKRTSHITLAVQPADALATKNGRANKNGRGA